MNDDYGCGCGNAKTTPRVVTPLDDRVRETEYANNRLRERCSNLEDCVRRLGKRIAALEAHTNVNGEERICDAHPEPVIDLP